MHVQAEQFTDDVLLPVAAAATLTKTRLLRARARTESSAWRAEPREGREMLDLLADEAARLRGQVTLSTSRRVALSSSTGTINVNVSNALNQPVTVGVGLNDPIEARLTSTSTGTREVPGTAVVQVPIEVTTRTSANSRSSSWSPGRGASRQALDSVRPRARSSWALVAVAASVLGSRTSSVNWSASTTPSRPG